MARSSSLNSPLVGSINGDRSRLRRPLIGIAFASVALVLIVGAGLLLLDQFRAGRLSRPTKSSSLLQAPPAVSKILKQYARPISIKQVNALLKHLPVHDAEDIVFLHIEPHVENLYYSFLKRYGSTAPHFKTGEKLKKRHKIEDKAEFQYRLGVFWDFLRHAVRLNNWESRHSERPDHAVFGVTKFADWTFEEFQTLLKGPATRLNTTMHTTSKMSGAKNASQRYEHPTPPCTKNWVKQYPFLFEPRDQGSCGSCYAHAAVEGLRTHAYMNTGIDQGFLSAQCVLDCKGDGCSGGDAGDVMNWVSRRGGIPRKVDYGTYHASAGHCKAGIANAVTTTGAERFYEERATAEKLCESGPLSMGVYASDAFHAYVSGVLTHQSCHAKSPNHDTQVVAVFEDKRAFLIRNSWGKDWGINGVTLEPSSIDGGFILLEYGHNTCDLTDCNSFPKDVTCVGNCTDHPAPAPSPPPPDGYLCENTCQYADDGDCDDGGPGSDYDSCPYGSDCDDCEARPPRAPPAPAPPGYICNNTCQYADDDECDDGGPDSDGHYCRYGSDCDDCGARPPLPPPTPAPPGYLCRNTCQYADDGECDDGGPGSDYSYCSYGTDCNDCGSEPPRPSPMPGYICHNTCSYRDDNECDDGGPGSAYRFCPYGSDCDDCGQRPALATTTTTLGILCDNTCSFSHDGACDDGGPGSDYRACVRGTDCDDCGPRPGSSIPPLAPHCIPFSKICW